MSEAGRTIEKGCGAVLPGGHAWFHPACRSCAEHGFAPRPIAGEVAQPAHEPPATVTVLWCPECDWRSDLASGGHERRAAWHTDSPCRGAVQTLTYDLRAEPQRTREEMIAGPEYEWRACFKTGFAQTGYTVGAGDTYLSEATARRVLALGGWLERRVKAGLWERID